MKFKVSASGKTFKRIFNGVKFLNDNTVYTLSLENISVKEYLEIMFYRIFKPKRPKWMFIEK